MVWLQVEVEENQGFGLTNQSCVTHPLSRVRQTIRLAGSDQYTAVKRRATTYFQFIQWHHASGSGTIVQVVVAPCKWCKGSRHKLETGNFANLMETRSVRLYLKRSASFGMDTRMDTRHQWTPFRNESSLPFNTISIRGI